MAANSSLVLSGLKKNLNYARDHSVAESLDYVGVWNSAFLHSPDLQEAMRAHFAKDTPVYSSKL